MGMVFQNFNLFPHKTVLNNIILAPKLLNKSDLNQLKQEALTLLEKLDLKIRQMYILLNYLEDKTKSCDCKGTGYASRYYIV